jgi:NAD(P)H-nitrite reductase large subunit
MRIVIIGSGIAGISFAEKCLALASIDSALPAVEITLVTYEHDGYYSRPLLSRGFTKDDIERSIILKSFDKIRDNGINVISAAEVTAIDRHSKSVAITRTGQETTLSYDKLILAQGSAAFIPPPFRPFEALFFSLNSLVDLKTIRAFRQTLLNQQRQPHWAIVGGGLIGCEVASDLAVAGDDVTVFHAMDRLMERQLVEDDSALLLDVLQHSGVTVLLNQNVQSFAKHGEKITVQTDSVEEFDGLIVACGFKPRTTLAEKASLSVGRGIKVNAFLQTNDEDIFALGDVAELPNGKVYAYIIPIRSQALWLAGFILGQEQTAWNAPKFASKAKVHGFEAVHPYNT